MPLAQLFAKSRNRAGHVSGLSASVEMPARRTILISLVALVATLCCAAILRLPNSALSRAELAARDVLSRHGKRAPASPELIFLAVDNASISLEAGADLQTLFGIENDATPEGRALTLMSQEWPWSREVYALILDRLVAAGARVVAFDLIFPSPSEGDDALRAALERHRDRVVIGSNFTASADGPNRRIDAALTLPAATLIAPSRTPDDRVGFVNFWPDADGVIRNAQFQMTFAEFLSYEELLGESHYTSLAAQAVRKAGRPDLVPVDTVARPFTFTAPPREGFPPRSIFEIFVPEYWKRNFRNGEAFNGAIVVVGAAGNWQHDEHETPLGVMAGPEIQLNVINALLHGQFLRPPSWLFTVGISLAAALLAAAVAIACVAPLWRIGAMAGLAAAWLGAQLPLHDRAGILLPIVSPLAVLIVTGLFSLIYDLLRTLAEEFRLRVALVERKRAQEILEQSNAELERRVGERTAALTEANAALTRLLDEKTVLLKEVHHRVKNNLQIISSLLNLQSSYIQDPTALSFFNESRNRVRSMALIHEKLYQSQDLAKIDFEDYLRTLTSGLQSSFAGRASGVRMALEVDAVMLGVDSAVPCGLIVNELVTNCFKYAFRDQPGEIRISMRRGPDARFQLTVADNGIGFPKEVDFRNTESLGMQLVTTLTEQLDGTIELRNGVGTTFEISFPEATAKRP
jgi:two-component sensor histidine kinase/CHASE2 domain-containing sensor protein